MEDYRLVKAARRTQGELDFAWAQTMALEHGLFLRRNSDTHYTLAAGQAGSYVWLWDLYPGKCRVKKGRHHPATPFLPLTVRPWRLSDVVQAAIQVKEGDPKEKEKDQ